MKLSQVLLISVLVLLSKAEVTNTEQQELTQSQAWGFSMLAGVCLIIVGLIAGQVLMCVKGCISVSVFRLLLNMLYALACGTMVGDVILHSLPQAFTSTSTKLGYVGLLFLLSILFYIVMDRSFKYCGLTMQRWGTVEELPPPELPDTHDHGPGQLRDISKKPETTNRNIKEPLTLKEHWQSFAIPQLKIKEELRKIRERQAQQKQKRKRFAENIVDRDGGEMAEDHVEIQIRGSNKHLDASGTNKPMIHAEDRNPKEQTQNFKSKEENSKDLDALRSFTTYQRRSEFKRSAKLLEDARKREEELQKRPEDQNCIDRLRGKKAEGYLEIFTSFIHNFIDGFALGVGFGSRDNNQYISILVAVYTHAIPRELGDIAILIKSGFDDCQTTFFSAIPKIMIIPGVAVGIALQTTGQSARYYILTFVAGTFLYIASDIWKNLFLTNDKWKNLAELGFLVLGVGIEYLLLLVEH